MTDEPTTASADWLQRSTLDALQFMHCTIDCYDDITMFMMLMVDV
jgi:hypothetical protein